MSRSGYTDDIDSAEDQARYICWRGAVASAIRGKRGQAFLRELRDALDAMPEKRLMAGDFIAGDGDCCALGAVAMRRGLTAKDLPHPDDAPYEREEIAKTFGIAEALVAEIMAENDDNYVMTDEGRWHWMRRWVEKRIKPTAIGQGGE